MILDLSLLDLKQITKIGLGDQLHIITSFKKMSY